jgi:hypothetical protein
MEHKKAEESKETSGFKHISDVTKIHSEWEKKRQEWLASK